MKSLDLNNSFHTQSGSVLTVSLFILLVITIVGATAINDTVMEEKMSSNFQNGHTAFQAAEPSVNRTVLEIAQNRDLVEQAIAAKENAEGDAEPNWPKTDPYTMSGGAHNSTTLNSTVQYVGDNKFPAAGCTVVIGRPTACMAVVVDVVALSVAFFIATIRAACSLANDSRIA